MSLRTRIAEWLDPARKAPSAVRGAPRTLRRNFAAADQSKLTASFSGEHISMNQALETGLRVMRSRSRLLAKNNDYVRKFFRMVQNHVVGPQGFTLSVPCLRPDGTIDEFDRGVCERAFGRWSKRGVCDVTGRLSLVQLERLVSAV